MKSSKFIAILGTLLLSIILIITYFIATNTARNKLQFTIKSQLQQVINELAITLERHSYLPVLLSTDSNIIDYLDSQTEGNVDNKKQSKINLSLELTNNISESSVIYVMKPDGTTVASSNWQSSHSFIGKNFAFRPYFQQAMQNILGRYYAVGAVTGERGYFFARSVHSNNKIIGVVVVKVAIDDIEFTWGQGSADFMVTDSEGVIFLSSQKSWNLHSLQPISKEQEKRLEKNRRYGSQLIYPLENTVVNLGSNSFQKVQLLGSDHEMITSRMELADWDVRVFSSHLSMKKTVFSIMLVTGLILSLLTALVGLLWKSQRQKKKFQQQITDSLENKVIERTQALKQSQEDLIQAAKMAALGQLSAGITHEINNPLAAIRAYADNASIFLKKNQFDMVESNLVEITTLTEGMATLTSQLKSFSRKSKGEIKPVLLGHAIDSALLIVHPKILSSSVTCYWDALGHGANKSVLADEIWLGQILVNLFTNAISATSVNKNDKEERKIWIGIQGSSNEAGEAPQLCIQVRDNGLGIDDSALPHIFEPFFTTKPSSKGLGLGLSISLNLAKDMNGFLKAHNHKDGGAVFTLCLPKIDQV